MSDEHHGYPRHFGHECGIDLEPFQKRIARAIAGPEPEPLVTMPRGGGKTALTALIALHHLVTVPDAAIYVAAASRQQASLLFEYADRYARRLEHPNLVHRHLELRWCDDPDQPKVASRRLEVRAADARVAGTQVAICNVVRLDHFFALNRFAAPRAILPVRRDDHPLFAQRVPAFFPDGGSTRELFRRRNFVVGHPVTLHICAALFQSLLTLSQNLVAINTSV